MKNESIQERLILTPEEAQKEDFLERIRKNVGFLSFDHDSAKISQQYPAEALYREFEDEINLRFEQLGLDAPVAIIGYGSLIGGGGRASIGDVPQDFVEICKWERRLDSAPNCWRTQQLGEGLSFSTTGIETFQERSVASVQYNGAESSAITAVMMPKTLRDVTELTSKFDVRESPYVLVPVGMENIRYQGKTLNVPALILHPVSEIVALQRFGRKALEDMCLMPADKIRYVDSVDPLISYTNQILRGAAETPGREVDLAKTTMVRDMTLERWLSQMAPGNNAKIRPWHGTGNESVDPLMQLEHFPKPPPSPEELQAQNRKALLERIVNDNSSSEKRLQAEEELRNL